MRFTNGCSHGTLSPCGWPTSSTPRQSEGGYSKIHLSILLPNKLQIILDNIAVLNEQKRERGGSRFENRFDDLTP